MDNIHILYLTFTAKVMQNMQCNNVEKTKLNKSQQ